MGREKMLASTCELGSGARMEGLPFPVESGTLRCSGGWKRASVSVLRLSYVDQVAIWPPPSILTQSEVCQG